jgi:hypothetical protein
VGRVPSEKLVLGSSFGTSLDIETPATRISGSFTARAIMKEVTSVNQTLGSLSLQEAASANDFQLRGSFCGRTEKDGDEREREKWSHPRTKRMTAEVARSTEGEKSAVLPAGDGPKSPLGLSSFFLLPILSAIRSTSPSLPRLLL